MIWHTLHYLVNQLQSAADSGALHQIRVLLAQSQVVRQMSSTEVAVLRSIVGRVAAQSAEWGPAYTHALPAILGAQSAEELCALLEQMLDSAAPSPSRSLEPEGDDRFRRWATAVVEILDARHDPTRIGAWAQLLTVSPETLRTWCKSANLSTKKSLDLGRILRAVRHAKRRQCSIECLIDVAHPSTQRRLLSVGGVESWVPDSQLVDLLERQRLIRDPNALLALRLPLLSMP